MASINTYWSIQSKINKKSSYESRKKQVSSVRTNVETVADDNIGYINGKIDSITSLIELGIKGLSGIDTYCDKLEALKECNCDSDTQLDAARDDLWSEIEDCTSKIDKLQDDIDALYVTYYQQLDEEAEALKKVTGKK